MTQTKGEDMTQEYVVWDGGEGQICLWEITGLCEEHKAIFRKCHGLYINVHAEARELCDILYDYDTGEELIVLEDLWADGPIKIEGVVYRCGFSL